MDLSAESEDELYQRLGSLLLGRGPGAGALDPARLRDFGVRHFDGLRAGLGAALCKDDGTAKLPGDDIRSIATAILAYQVTAETFHATEEKALVLAALVMKVGINRFCNGLKG